MIARKAAKAYGFNDPVETLNRIRKFSRPSETNEPIELLRAGFAFHARGLANTKAIQNNLDWIWPFWIQKQYNPKDESFIPRAFSFSHINLTQRNWTAVGLPDCEEYSIVDPRGLVTPFHDSWSIDFWMVTDKGTWFLPCKERYVTQTMRTGEDLAVITKSRRDGMSITSEVRMEPDSKGEARLSVKINAESRFSGQLVYAVRPYNPEGIQFIDAISFDTESNELVINGKDRIRFSDSKVQLSLSNYKKGDVAHFLNEVTEENSIHCEAGMASAAASVNLKASTPYHSEISIPIKIGETSGSVSSWSEKLKGTTRIKLPNEAEQKQYERSLQTLALLSPKDIYPGPYTYRRFWFRDACLIAHALLRTGQEEACRRALEEFPARQTKDGYFRSQEGEWDSNGQVLWIYDLYERMTGKELPEACFDTIKPAMKWISNKLCQEPGSAHHGLLPPGFSAEHFGPNDFYYWDDFWAVGGLRAARDILLRRGMNSFASTAEKSADKILTHIEDSLDSLSSQRAKGHMPASPYRRLDSGAIGSLVSDYPLQIWDQEDSRIRKTADYLYKNCLVDGAFFQDMIHSGLNIYLTLDLAQTFLRAGDPRWEELANRCLELSSPTGQWPEAINPRTLGGCMGDGQHAWAAAEWLLFTLNRFVREENDRLIIGSGICERWIESGETLTLENAPTSYGPLSLEVIPCDEGSIRIEIDLSSRTNENPLIEYRIPGYDIKSGRNIKQVELVPENRTATIS